MTLLHSVRYGSGSTTVVFLGSLGSIVDMWLPQLDALSHDATVIALDHRGHGRSPIGTGPGSIKALADASLATLNSLNVESFHLVGISLGGAVAQYLAAAEGGSRPCHCYAPPPSSASQPDGLTVRASRGSRVWKHWRTLLCPAGSPLVFWRQGPPQSRTTAT